MSRALAVIVGFSVAVILSPTSEPQAETKITITGLGPGEVQSASFAISEDADIHVRAIGAERKASEAMFAYAWILDAKSRSLVWSMDEDFTEPVEDSEWLREFDDDIGLKAGSYEVYLTAGQPYFFGDFSDGDVRDLLDALGAWLDKKDKGGQLKWDSEMAEKVARHLMVEVSGAESVMRRTAQAERPKAVVSLVEPDNDAYLSHGFTVEQDVDLEIYAIGEYSKSDDIMVDRGWIIDAATRERVWDMERLNTDWAGGAEKNRLARERHRFTKGDYVAYYVTDDSHTYGDWNSNPPFDPEGWGLQIFAVNSGDIAAIAPFEDSYNQEPVIRLTRVGDNELVTEAFRVESPTKLRVYAIGEYDRFSDRMADYGWIARADRSQKVWVMRGSETEPAGGDSKNRQSDEVVELTPGDYVVYYTTDGSHSYGSGWNTSPPYDQRSYGISIYPIGSGQDVRVIKIDERQMRAPNAIAAILDVRDDEERSEDFSLTSPTRVRIHAVGEGTRGGMVDYGWIEDRRTGDVVWEMTYRKTEHAGGA
ncbi:MAG: hypothetical protein AB1752_08855, partial [Candidatus Zixiibacteriota bacterium]